MNISKDSWTPDQNPNLINDFLTTHINQRLAELILFARSIKTLNEQHPAKVHLDKSMRFAKTIPLNTLAAIFSEPEFHYWSYISRCMRGRIENNEQVPLSDTPHLFGVLNHRSEDPILMHTLELNRFLLASSIMESSPFECDILVHDGYIVIPRLGLVVKINSTKSTVSVNLEFEDGASLHIDGQKIDGFDTCVNVALEKKGVFMHGDIAVLPWVRMSTGTFVINGLEPYFRHSWVTSYQGPDGSNYGEITLIEYERWHAILNQTISLLAQCWPKMEADIGAAIRSVIPVRCLVPSVHMSCSKDVMGYALLMSEGNPTVLAEAFVHEFSHNILNSLSAFDSVFKEPIRTISDLYSPWRPDARHILGLFHAVFVFERVCEFYLRYLNLHKDDEVSHRFRLMTIRNLMAIDVVSSVVEHLDSLGLQILDMLRCRVNEHAQSLTVDDWKLAQPELTDHYHRWLLTNQPIEPPTIATLNKLMNIVR